MANKHKKFSPEEKVRLLRRHRNEKNLDTNELYICHPILRIATTIQSFLMP